MRYLNMFVLIGVALLGIGLAKLLSQGRMLAEPGQTPGPQDAWIYLGAGVLMLINGVVSIRQAVPAAPKAVEK
jgi:hypothetical protein